MILPENIVFHEMIGLQTMVTKSSNNSLLGVQGKIIDETQSMFYIKTDNGVKLIPKNQSNWEFHLRDQKITLDGSKLNRRSEDRLEAKN